MVSHNDSRYPRWTVHFGVSLIIYLLSGCALDGEIANSTVSHEPRLGDIRVVRQVFLESIGFDVEDVEIDVIGSGTITVSGKIVGATLRVKELDRQFKYRALGAYYTNRKWCPAGQVGLSKLRTVPWAIKTVSISIGGLAQTDTRVTDNGHFAAVLKMTTADLTEGFTEPDLGRYEKSDKRYVTVSLQAKHSGDYFEEYGHKQRPTRVTEYHAVQLAPNVAIHRRCLDTGKARSYAATLLRDVNTCQVRLGFVDGVTRVGVIPKVTVEAADSPSEEDMRISLRSAMMQEFDQNEDLVSVGMAEIERRFEASYDDVLWGGEAMVNTSQSVSFVAVVGEKYQIETVHSDYYYFKGFITPESSTTIEKSVLLVEKGGKVRVQGVDEGEGGVMIGSE